MPIDKKTYGNMPDGREITHYTLQNNNAVKVGIINYGAIVESIIVPDHEGNPADIALGFDNLHDWVQRNDPYFGATIGRCANRIGKGRFAIDGIEYQLAINNGPNCLHGGEIGFDKKVWDAEESTYENVPAVKLQYLSPDGEENFTGNLACSVKYALTDDNALVIEYEAETDQATVANLTNHTYFNLAGHDAGHIGEHVISIAADQYTPADQDLLPTGEIKPVDGLPIDLREPVRIDSRMGAIEGGFDHNYVVGTDGNTEMPVARVEELSSGRTMEVFTTEPGMQFYTGNFLGGIIGKQGVKYADQSAFCLEAQRFPDAVNHENFPEVVLRPGEKYRQTTVYRFNG